MFGPITCLIIGIALIIVLMLVLRFHAFLALISSAIIIALLSNQIPIGDALPLVASQFGQMMGSIGILLAMAAIIGKCLMDSGAAERIVRAFSRVFGKGREHYSLLSSGFVLSIPVFFDTVFYLLAPLARAVYAKRKQNYILIICAAAAGGAITHALVPPTPGPIMVAEQLDEVTRKLADPVRVTILLTTLVGILASIVPVITGGILYARWIDKRISVVPKDALGVSQSDLEAISQKPTSELPSLWFSLLPFILPVILLAGSSITLSLLPEIDPQNPVYTFSYEPALRTSIQIFGDKNLVFFLGALIAIALLVSQKRTHFKQTIEQLEPAIASGAIIAFITCAGGSFGKVLAASGVGDVIAHAAEHWNLSLLVVAFLSASLIRIAQGSATVAMITAAGVIAPTLAAIPLPYHPVYLVAAIGFGATGYSWMNDSGFWIVSQLTGLNERQTLQTWTAMLTIMAITGFLWVWILSILLPLTPAA
ncbi:MAG: GntP family permease [Candidatus Hinthialibacter sp.]